MKKWLCSLKIKLYLLRRRKLIISGTSTAPGTLGQKGEDKHTRTKQDSTTGEERWGKPDPSHKKNLMGVIGSHVVNRFARSSQTSKNKSQQKACSEIWNPSASQTWTWNHKLKIQNESERQCTSEISASPFSATGNGGSYVSRPLRA